jgi:hypothetical protein
MGTVDSTQYQHTSVMATAKEIFGLPSFLTKRDATANTFTHLFSLTAARTDTPPTLQRAPLPAVTTTPDQQRHPTNQALDETQREILLGAYHLTQSSHPNGPAADELPKTQGEAAKFIRARFVEHFGPLAGPGAHLAAKSTKARKLGGQTVSSQARPPATPHKNRKGK